MPDRARDSGGPAAAGASNIGNPLATHVMPTTPGFGVCYWNLQGTDEAIEAAAIAPVHSGVSPRIETAAYPDRARLAEGVPEPIVGRQFRG
jgi:hypothetical protein